MIPENIFREYDIRGMAATELTDELAENLGRAFGSAMIKEGKKRISLGHDLRTSSERLQKALMRGLLSTELEVTELGLVPTPLVYFSVSHLGLDGGICVTGSHNPPEYNGFKFHLAERPFYGTEIQELRRLMEKGVFVQGTGKKVIYDKIIAEYKSYVAGLFRFKRKIKVVVDSGHAMAGLVAPDLIRSLGHEVTELYSNLDSHFPDHHPDPSVPSNLRDLQTKVVETKADLGLAFDGDMDRIGVVDETGEIIPGDKILLLYAREILRRKPGSTVIGDVKCSQQLYDDVASRGGRAMMWKTGHSLIKAKMKETKAEVAGEMSGHMFFRDRWFGFDDALYAACRMLEILELDHRPLSDHLSDLPRLFSTPEIRVDCPDEIKFDVVRHATAAFKKKYKVIDTDGARILFQDGWGLVRASNTQPVLVMRFEAKSKSRVAEIQKIVEDQIALTRQER